MLDPMREDQKKEAFRTLVQLQDEGRTTEQSRAWVAAQYCINVREMQEVEREGIRNQWPPL